MSEGTVPPVIAAIEKAGGPAFPAALDTGEGTAVWIGMTLRDYFAIHCDQPGEAEIAVAAGLGSKSPAGHFLDKDGETITFAEWWGSLSQSERFALYAKVRYGLADAMLAERSK